MDAQYTKEMAELQTAHWWYEGRRRILSSIIARLKLPHDAKILEAGCGPGANLNMLSKFGAVSAFEPDDFSVENARTLSSADVQNGTLPNGIPFHDQFDLVCAFDVIEHIDDDLASVRALHGATAGGGYALFTVPAFKFLWSHHDEINFHKRRYTRASLHKVLVAAGYRVEFISYYNFWLFPLAAGVRFIKNIIGAKEQGSDVQMPKSDAVNKLLCAVFASEKHMLKRFALPFGLSVIALCHKEADKP